MTSRWPTRRASPGCARDRCGPDKVRALTIKRNTVAVVTDGTAVLGLGNIGPKAAMPVMEGKAMLFQQFAGVDAWPICLDTKDTDEIIAIVKAIAPGFGGINLEDIAAPALLRDRGAAAARARHPRLPRRSAWHRCRGAGRAPERGQAGEQAARRAARRAGGVGAAGVAVSKILMEAGVRDIIGCDREGAPASGQEGLTAIKKWYARNTNPRGFTGTPNEALRAQTCSSAFRAGRVSVEAVRSMAYDAIVFAMANPDPEICPRTR